ncbi:RNA-binding protein [Lewinellaceae bacterium SD302]|nr:RNA-binding protein [Lewinellaceae bacterium SD302]
MKEEKKTRIDKWLWAVRIFKSRTLANDVVKRNKVSLNGKNAKPSTSVSIGDRVKVMKNGFELDFEVVRVIAKRVGAPIAQTCYVDHTPEEELNKYQDWFVGKAKGEFREKGTGRPTKRERRDISKFKEDYLEWDGDE